MKKENNNAVVKKYMMQLELDSTITQQYKMATKEEITVTKYATPKRIQQQPIFEIPIAIFKTFRPIVLKVNYKTQENLELTAKLRNETHYAGGFTAKGNIVISKLIQPSPGNRATVLFSSCKRYTDSTEKQI